MNNTNAKEELLRHTLSVGQNVKAVWLTRGLRPVGSEWKKIWEDKVPYDDLVGKTITGVECTTGKYLFLKTKVEDQSYWYRISLRNLVEEE